MAVSNATPKIQFTGNNSTTEFAFNFVVPASLTTGEITDSTASITQGTTTLTVSTSDLFYTSDLQGKAITIAGAGAGSSTLETTIVTVDSATQVTIANAASVTVSNAAIVVTTGKTGTTLKNNNEIEVFVDSTQQTINSDYTVRLNVGDDANKQGTVIFTSPPASSTIVSIVRNIELSRTSDFQAGGALTAKELNAQFDNVVMAVQDQKNDDDRFIQFPANEPASTSGVLPDATNRANKFFVFDSNGDIDVSNNINLPSADLSVSSITTTTGSITTLNTTTGTITNLTSNNVDINGGAIDGTQIGQTTPANAAFANLFSADVNFDGGVIDQVTIGGTTPADGTFADLTVTGTLTNTDGNFILGSVVATGADGYTGRALKGYQSNDLEISSNANVILTAGAGASHRVKLDDHVGFVDSNSSITVGARTHTGKILTSPNADMVLNPYNGASGGKLTVVSTDGIHIDGVNPKVKGLLQLELEDGSNNNNILLSNSADADTAGIQLTPHANSNVKLNQLNFPPVFPHHETGAIGVGKGLRLMYKKTVVFGLSGNQFTYPSANVGDKLVMSGANDNYGYVLFPVIGGTTSSSVTYIVLTPKQTWSTSGPYLIEDHLNQTTLFTSSSGTPSISTQNNDTGYHVGYQDQQDGQTTDGLTEGSSNLYYSDTRVLAKINATSIDALSDVIKGTPSQGDVLTFSGQTFQPVAPDSAPVTSVAGKTGVVVLETNDVSESSGGRLYYTNARFDTRLSEKTTSDLAEGTNLYYSDERVDDRVSNLLLGGTGISISYNDAGGSLTITNTDAGTNVVQDTSPQLGNGLDVNGHEIFSLSNQDIKIQPHGTGAVAVGADNTNATITTNGTGDLTLSTNGGTNSGTIKIVDGVDGDIELTPNGDGNVMLDGYIWPRDDIGGTAGQFLKISNASTKQLAWSTGSSAGMNDLVDDTTPQLGGTLDLNGQHILGQVNGTADTVLDSNSVGSDLKLKFNGTTIFTGNADTTITTQGTNGDIVLQPNGNGQVHFDTPVIEQHGSGGLIIHDQSQGGYTTSAFATPAGMLAGPGIQIDSEGQFDYPQIIMRNNSIDGYPNIWAAKARPNGGTDYSTDDYLDSGETIFRFYGAPYNGAATSGQEYFSAGAVGDFKASENHSSGNLGCKIEFGTINNGTTTNTTKLTIDDNIELGADLDTQTNALRGTDVVPSTGSYGGQFSGGQSIRLHNSTSDHAIRTQQASGRQNIAFTMDLDGSYSAGNSGSGLIYSPLNMQIRDRGESTKTRTTFDVGVPYRGGTGATITQGSVTGKLLDVVASDRKIYLQNVSGGSFATSTATTGVVTGTVTAVNSIGTNAVELTYDTDFATTAATTDLADLGFARFSARDVLNTNGMRTSEPELHLEAGRIAFESNGTKMLDITDSGNIVADISTGQTLSPFGGILSDPSNMVEIKGGRYASGLRIYDASVGDGTQAGFQLDPFHFDKHLGSDQKKGGQFSIQLFGEGLPKESYGSFGEGDALGVHQKFEIKDNSDYYIGTVNVTSGDATVEDAGGSLFSNASAGDWIRIEGAVSDGDGNAMSGNLNCTISSVASDNSTIEINVPASANSGKTLSDIDDGTGLTATIIKNSSTAIRMSAGTTGARHTFTHKSEQNGTNVDGNDRVELAFEAKKIIFQAGTDSDNVNAIQAENSEVIINEGQNDLDFRVHGSSNDDVLKVDAGDEKVIFGGHAEPKTDNTYDLGSSSKQFRNIYTGDMHLSNERHAEGNAVDGTKGNWTIQEGAEDLFLLNNNTGKKYKFCLKEIE